VAELIRFCSPQSTYAVGYVQSVPGTSFCCVVGEEKGVHGQKRMSWYARPPADSEDLLARVFSGAVEELDTRAKGCQVGVIACSAQGLRLDRFVSS
jgi:hypothetical protein